MTTVKEQVLKSFQDKEYRHAFARQHVMRRTALQIREMRKRRGLTQKDLGDATAMGQTSISELETPGVRRPNIETLQTLAEELDVVLFVRYGTFSELANEVAGLTYQDLAVPDYLQDPGRSWTATSANTDTETGLIREGVTGMRAKTKLVFLRDHTPRKELGSPSETPVSYMKVG